MLISLFPVVSESSEYQIFSPTPQEGGQPLPERGKGVLVRRITIKPGDSLYKISRDFSGRGAYFSQILLFNDIQNPDRIFIGKELFVPVSKKEALTSTAAQENKPPTVKSRTKSLKAAKVSASKEKKKRKSTFVAEQKKQLPAGQLKKRVEQDSYAAALSAYREKDYKQALSLFNRFLELYPSSALAPDASLQKAECLLKLSGL